MTNEEEWRDVVGYEGLYQVSELGNIRSLPRLAMRSNGKPLTINGKILSPGTDPKGYLRACLGKHNTMKVHRLVAAAFIPNPLNLPEVNHIDGNKQNNSIENLEWVSHADNVKHAVSIGKYSTRNSKISYDDVRAIKAEYVRSSQAHGTSALAKKYGVTSPYIWRIIHGKKRQTIGGAA